MPAPEFSEEINEIIAKWNAIERRVKEAEQICGEAIIPAINELRYAGRQFVDAMAILVQAAKTSEDYQKIERHLSNVRYNLTNADHDCTDAMCLFLHEKLGRLFNEYSLPLVFKYFPDYKECFERMEGANTAITASREDRKNRVATYQAIADFHIPRLYEFYNAIILSEPLILAHQKQLRIRWSVVAAVGVIAASILFFVLR